MSVYKNTSPKNKLIITVILFSVLLSFTMFVLNAKNKDSSVIFENLNKLVVNAGQLWVDLKNFETVVHDEDFYEYKEDNYSITFFETLNTVQLSYGKLNVGFTKNNSKFSYELLQLKSIFNDIEKNFKILVENEVKIGNKKTGLISNLVFTQNNAIQKINLLASNSVKQKLILLHQISEEVIDSRYTGNSEVFNSEILNIQKELRTENNTYYKDIVNALNEYQNSYNLVSALIISNGSQSTSGIKKELHDNIASSINILTEFNRNNSDAIKAEFPDYIKIILLTTFFTALMFIGLILLFLNPNQKNIRALKYNSDNILTENDNFVEITENLELININKNLKKIKQSVINTQKIISNIETIDIDTINKSYFENEIPSKEIIELKKLFDQRNKEEIEDKKRKKDENAKNNELSLFSQILRQKYDSVEDLSMKTIIELANYSKSQIVGLYIIKTAETKEKYLDMVASFAYNEERMLKRKFEFGEGLIGACAIEKTTFYFENIDDEYVKIVSGMGDTPPDNILIIPILLGNELYGVIEFASLYKYSKENIEFIELLGQDIASALSRFVN